MYAGHKIKVLGITEVSSNEGLLDSTSTNISIADIDKLFNPNNKTYFQSESDKVVNSDNVVDWTDKFDKVPTFEEIEKHIKDIIASGEVFDTLSPEWKIDIKGGNRVVDKITNQGNFQKLQNSAKKRHNKYVAGIKELINNSTYNHTGKNDKPKEKPNILNYHYFDVNIRIGDKVYLVRLECEENKKVLQGRYAKRSKQSHQNTSNLTQKNNNVKIVHLYNIKEIKKQKEYYQKTNGSFINKIKKIFSNDDKKISDFQKMNEYSDIKDFFDDVKDIKVKNLTKDIAKQLGVNENNLSFYDKNNNVIYINYDITKKLSSTAFNHSLFHEIIHAKQRMMYNFAKENLNNNALSSEIKNELKTYINYLDEDSKVVSDFVNYIKAKNVSDVSQLDSKGIELYNKYKFSSTEVDADNFAIALQYFRGERNDKGLQQFNRGLESGRNSSYFRGEKQNDGIQKRTYEAIKEFNARQKHSNERLSDYTTYYQELEDESYRGYFQPEVEVVGEE